MIRDWGFLDTELDQRVRHLINSNHNTLTKNVGIGLFSFLGIMVMYRRVYFKCHTIQQVLIGGLIGGTLVRYILRTKKINFFNENT